MINTFIKRLLNINKRKINIELIKRINWKFISIKDYKNIYVNINLVKSFYKENKKIDLFIYKRINIRTKIYKF